MSVDAMAMVEVVEGGGWWWLVVGGGRWVCVGGWYGLWISVLDLLTFDLPATFIFPLFATLSRQ